MVDLGKKIKFLSALTLALLICAHTALCAEGGYSNYVPGTYGDFAAGVAPATPLTIRNDLYYYGADSTASVRSGQVEVGAELTFVMDFFTLLHKPDVELFGAQYIYGVFIPLSYIDVESSLRIGPTTVTVQDDIFSLGDVAIIPMLLMWNSGNFHISLAESIVAPTGEYDTSNLVNTGLNYWTFDTNMTVNYLNPETGQDYSVNIGYNYNTENSDTNYQTGAEFHMDYMINQFLSETFALGIQGFYLKQLEGDSGSGAVLGDFKAEAAGVGPALMWYTSIGDMPVALIAKWLHEYHAENRLEGDHAFASFALSF